MEGDIIAQDVDAIVTLIPQTLEYRGEINEALLKAAGTQLDDFVLENVISPRIGDVYSIPGFNLPCRHIIFCIVPVWRTDFDRQDRLLRNACRRAMERVGNMGLRSVAFPPLASGRNGFPKPRAARLIVKGIADRLGPDMQEVRIVCRQTSTIKVFKERLITMGWHE